IFHGCIRAAGPGLVRSLRPFLPALLWGLAVWVIGGLPSSAIPVGLGRGLDKIAHFAMYGTLGFLAGRAWFAEPRRVPWILPLLIILGVSAADELRQRSVRSRTADVTDWMADGAGAA